MSNGIARIVRYGAPAACVVAALATGGTSTQAEGMEMEITITSKAFENDGTIPRRYTCEGDDVSPPLAWSGLPDGTRSLVLIVDDPDAPDPDNPRMTWVHWVLYDLPPTAAGLASVLV